MSDVDSNMIISEESLKYRMVPYQQLTACEVCGWHRHTEGKTTAPAESANQTPN